MSGPLFFVGLHQPSDAKHRLRTRKSDFDVGHWLMDSGAFTEISTHGHYRSDVASYAADIRRWAGCGELAAAVAQDWMCEPWIVAKTGLSVAKHQQLTVERFDALADHDLPVPILPVLQGYDPQDYRRHVDAYGDRLTRGMWVGVGSVCKRNASPSSIVAVLATIHRDRPDLRLHGFGLKKTALLDPGVRSLLYSADSMAWSFNARRNGRNGNDWREAQAFSHDVSRIADAPKGGWQWPLDLVAA